MQHNKKVLILLSDGEDHGEELKAELRELMRASHSRILHRHRFRGKVL